MAAGASFTRGTRIYSPLNRVAPVPFSKTHLRHLLQQRARSFQNSFGTSPSLSFMKFNRRTFQRASTSRSIAFPHFLVFFSAPNAFQSRSVDEFFPTTNG